MNIYNNLVKLLDGTEKLLDKKLCSQITKLPKDNIEDIYLLILHHAFIKEDYSKKSLLSRKELPYGSKYIDKKEMKGLIFKPHSLPEELQRIIYKYLNYVLR